MSTESLTIAGVEFPVADFNYFQKLSYSQQMPPVIGIRPAKRSWRWWAKLFHTATWLHDHIARLVKESCGDSYYCGEFFWTRNEWPWLDAVGLKMDLASERPIYDPDWKFPGTITVGGPPAIKHEWGINRD